jgi:hypothetical protein
MTVTLPECGEMMKLNLTAEEIEVSLTAEEIEMIVVALEEFEFSVGQAVSSDECEIIEGIRGKLGGIE